MRAAAEGLPRDASKRRNFMRLNWECNRVVQLRVDEDIVEEFADDEGLDIVCGPDGCYAMTSVLGKLPACEMAGGPRTWYKMNRTSVFNLCEEDDPDLEYWWLDMEGTPRTRIDRERFRDFGVLAVMKEGVRTVMNMEQKELIEHDVQTWLTVPVVDMIELIPEEGKANAMRLYLRNADSYQGNK